MKILLFDFDDSFTCNISEVLFRIGLSCKTLHWSEYGNLDSNSIVILGPGPGYISEYKELVPLIKDNITKGIFHLGVCLGHQLIASAFGGEIKKTQPIHGETIELYIPAWKFFSDSKHHQKVEVQKYNSWEVKSIPDAGGLVISQDFHFLSGDNFISYQFHPESVGTTFPEIFFEGLKDKLGL